MQVGILKTTGDTDTSSAKFEEHLYRDACKAMAEGNHRTVRGKTGCIVGKTD